MFKSFKVYVEEKDDRIKEIKNKLIEKMGFNPHAMKDTTLTLRKLDKHQFMQAISSVGLDKGTVEKLKGLFLSQPDTSIQDVINQIGPNDATESDPNSYEVGQDMLGQNLPDDGQQDIPEVPAQLPTGQKQLPKKLPRKPLSSDKDIGISMYGGPPPMDGKLT